MSRSHALIARIVRSHADVDLQDVFRICLQKNKELPARYDDWAACIQRTYELTGAQASLGETASAIYAVWTDPELVPAIDHRVTRDQLVHVLTGLEREGRPAFDPDAVTRVVDAHYLEITITVDVAAILSENDNHGAGQPVWVPQHVTMRDNHPETSVGEGTVELNSEGLVPTMTVRWRAVAKGSGHTVDLTAFVPRDQAHFEEFAPMPERVPGTRDQWLTRARGTLPAHEVATYHFTFTVDGGTTTYAFDPFIGTEKVS